MDVIFIKDLRGQGKKGDVKKVKDGYGKNYLIKNGYAIQKNESNLKILDAEQKKVEIENKIKEEKATKTKEKLDKEILIFKMKTGKDDKVFGSISAKQVKDELKKLGYEIDKTNIIIETPISSIGYHKIKINIYKKIFSELKIQLIK